MNQYTIKDIYGVRTSRIIPSDKLPDGSRRYVSVTAYTKDGRDIATGYSLCEIVERLARAEVSA